MHVCLVINAKLPVRRYGGTERVVYWLGMALSQLGHKVTFLAKKNTRLGFADVIHIDPHRPIEKQLPANVHFKEQISRCSLKCTTGIFGLGSDDDSLWAYASLLGVFFYRKTP